MEDKDYYEQRLYPLMDAVLARIAALDNEFYLSGGTAASRAYLKHRFSDDLDFFVNDRSEFSLWSDRVIAGLNGHPDWSCEIILRDDRRAQSGRGPSTAEREAAEERSA